MQQEVQKAVFATDSPVNLDFLESDVHLSPHDVLTMHRKFHCTPDFP